jgi:polysaccharide biosynthesis protein PelD
LKSAASIAPDMTVRAARSHARPSLWDRFKTLHARGRVHRVLGLRTSAVIEIVLLVAALVAYDILLGRHNRFAHLTPSPFWIVVLLASSYYGMREGLFAAALSMVAITYGGHLPIRPNEVAQVKEWIVRVGREPVLWVLVALVLGSIRDAFRQRMLLLQERLTATQERSDALTHACEVLTRQKQSLETRVVSRSVTVNAMYNASRAVDRDGVGDVLMGVSELVRTTLAPRKFSLYLLQDTRLEAAISEGWDKGDHFERVFDADHGLYEAVVNQSRTVVIVHPDDEALLRDEGLLAGPIMDSTNDTVIGMLKIESMEFVELNVTTLRNFELLCRWIGASLGHAQRMERYAQSPPEAGHGRVGPATMAQTLRAMMQWIVQRTGNPATLVSIELTPQRHMQDPERVAALARSAATALGAATTPDQACCATNDQGAYLVALPGHNAQSASSVAAHLIRAVRQGLEDDGLHAIVRHRIEPLAGARS